jgi:hypothetical protein
MCLPVKDMHQLLPELTVQYRVGRCSCLGVQIEEHCDEADERLMPVRGAEPLRAHETALLLRKN